MSSVQTIFFGQVPYYENLDESRISVQNTNQYSYSQECREQKNTSKQIQSQRKDESADLSHFKTPEQQKQKTPRQKTITSLLPDALAQKTQSRKQEITIYFFNSDKRMSFQKQELNRHFDKRQNITIKEFISFVVKSYCRLILNFQPMEISQQSFELKLANFQNHDDGILDPFSHSLPITYLYDADNLVMIRKERPTDKINDWSKLFNEKADLQIVQVLMPEKKELTLQIQKTKTINYLKQKISSYTNQLGKIVLVSYNGFKICENKKKINELDEKTFQVYRQRLQEYIDKPIIKNFNGYNYNNVTFYEELWKSPSKDENQSQTPQQFFVNETALFGKLTLTISRHTIIQKYIGGTLSSFPLSFFLYGSSDERIHTFSIHTLVGIKNSTTEQLILKFMYKNHCQLKTYKFQYAQKKQNFLRHILKIGRIYNKKWDRIK